MKKTVPPKNTEKSGTVGPHSGMTKSPATRFRPDPEQRSRAPLLNEDPLCGIENRRECGCFDGACAVPKNRGGEEKESLPRGNGKEMMKKHAGHTGNPVKAGYINTTCPGFLPGIIPFLTAGAHLFYKKCETDREN